MKYIYLMALTILFTQISLAQSKGVDVCKEGDCTEQMLSLFIEAPLLPSSYDQQRTDHIISVFQPFHELSQEYLTQNKWIEKRDESALRGKQCLNYYLLEAFFAFEYLQNKAFQNHIDSIVVNPDNFVELGFQASKKGLNLYTRMSSNCPGELTVFSKEKNIRLDDLATMYKVLGESLNYFDNDGKLMKPLTRSTASAMNLVELNENRQVDAMKNLIEALPFTVILDTKINALIDRLYEPGNAIRNLSNELDIIQFNLDVLNPNINAVSKSIRATVKHLEAMQGLETLFPKKDLFTKIKGLNERGIELKNRAQELQLRGQTLQEQHQSNKDGFDAQIQKMEFEKSDLKKKREYLVSMESQKKALMEKLDDKPKKILSELRRDVTLLNNQTNTVLKHVLSYENDRVNIFDLLSNIDKKNKDIERQYLELDQQKDFLFEEYQKLDAEKAEAEIAINQLKTVKKEVEALKNDLSKYDPSTELNAKLINCRVDLKTELRGLSGVDISIDFILQDIDKAILPPDTLLETIDELLAVLEGMELFDSLTVLPQPFIDSQNSLRWKTDSLKNEIDTLVARKDTLKGMVNSFYPQLDSAKAFFVLENKKLDSVQYAWDTLVVERKNIFRLFNRGLDNADSLKFIVPDFLSRYKKFNSNFECNGPVALQEKINFLRNAIRFSAQELDSLSSLIVLLKPEVEQLRTQTSTIKEKFLQTELNTIENIIKDKYGSTATLNPVVESDWHQKSSIKRSLWEAHLESNSELLEGKNGRYYKVTLKNNNRKNEAYFGPGQYCIPMDNFGKKFGPSFNAFIIESLFSVKKENRSDLRLYIQGLADDVGADKFSGNLESNCLFEFIEVFPKKIDTDQYESYSTQKVIPQNDFKNHHLPNLRAQFLKNAVQMFTDYFQPVILDGQVKKAKDLKDANATIYLYVPEK